MFAYEGRYLRFLGGFATIEPHRSEHLIKPMGTRQRSICEKVLDLTTSNSLPNADISLKDFFERYSHDVYRMGHLFFAYDMDFRKDHIIIGEYQAGSALSGHYPIKFDFVIKSARERNYAKPFYRRSYGKVGFDAGEMDKLIEWMGRILPDIDGNIINIAWSEIHKLVVIRAGKHSCCIKCR